MINRFVLSVLETIAYAMQFLGGLVFFYSTSQNSTSKEAKLAIGIGIVLFLAGLALSYGERKLEQKKKENYKRWDEYVLDGIGILSIILGIGAQVQGGSAGPIVIGIYALVCAHMRRNKPVKKNEKLKD